MISKLLILMKMMIIKLKKPNEKDVNIDLQWFSKSLGLFGERDKEKSCFRVFLELIKAVKRRKSLSSDEIALRSNLSRATVIHHLNRLQEAGLVVPSSGKYVLRVENLEGLVEEIKKDALRMLGDINDIARDIDEELGLIKRAKSKTSTVYEEY